jgi:hypothetical protein
MVATIDTTQAQYFIPEIWANAGIEILRKNIVATPRLERDSEVAVFQRGDILHVPYPGTFAANDKAAGTAYTLQQPTGEAEVQLTLNKQKEATFVVEDVVRAQADPSIMARYAEAAAIALAEQVETDVITELQTASNTVGTYGTDLTASSFRSARKTMTDNKAPTDGRTAIVHTKDGLALLADSTLATYFAMSQPAGVSEGSLGRIYGFDVFESQFIVTNTGPNPDETKCVAFRRDGAMIAFRALPGSARRLRRGRLEHPRSAVGHRPPGPHGLPGRPRRRPGDLRGPVRRQEARRGQAPARQELIRNH